MNLTIDNTSCEEIIFTQGGVSHSLDKLYYGQNLVWEKQSGPVNPYATQYFTIESLDNNNNIVLDLTYSDGYMPNGTGPRYEDLNYVSYSVDGGTTWNTTTMNGYRKIISVTLNSGDKMMMKGEGFTYATNWYNSSQDGWARHLNTFTSTGRFKCYGNIMSLLFGDNFVGQTAFRAATTDTTYTNNSIFAMLFYECNITDIKDLVMPATTLRPACYQQMFRGCTSITSAPLLPAATLKTQCYEGMFMGCTSLNEIKCDATDISAGSCVTDWLNNVAANGTFYKNANMTGWSTGISGIPSGWTVTNL